MLSDTPAGVLSPAVDAISGCLLGSAVGDAMGLPYEGLSRWRGRRLLGAPNRHRFIFGRGMFSDDTEHAIFTAQALIRSKLKPDAFEKCLARSLRWWLASIPAGIGLATLRSIIKLWLGISPSRSGVHSAGNGPAMRAPLLGVALGAEPENLRAFVLRSTRMTHSDPRAFHGAMAAAVAAHLSATESVILPDRFLEAMQQMLCGAECGELMQILLQVVESVKKGESLEEFASSIGCAEGISGYILRTIPCVIHVWLRHQDDYPGGITEVISAGGDADTTAAILGGIIGARTGKDGIPREWLDRLAEWPHDIEWLEMLCSRLSDALAGKAAAAPVFFTPAIIPRNALFLATVLCHGFRRLAPPYK